MSKYEELKYVLSGATDWGYEYAKKEDVEAAFAELEERHAMELDQWVLELEKIKAENERLKNELKHSEDELESYFIFEKEIKQKLRATRRALYKACANWAHHRVFVRFDDNEKAWENMERKCLKKAEEYK